MLFGYQNRRPGRWSALTDTVLQIVPHRRHTLIGHKPGFMFHAESFWPDLLDEPEIRVALRPLAPGLRTDILGIHFKAIKTASTRGAWMSPASCSLGWKPTLPSTCASSAT